MILNRPQVVPTPDRLHMMHSQIGLCTDIVRSAMNFLRHETQRFAILNINDVAETCLTVSMPLLQKMAVKVKRDLGQQVPLCEGDFVLMRQAVLNLITNACQAMDGQAPPREIHIRTWRDEDNVCISVSDTGPGVPIENRSKIFDTFYSTKGKNGTGLGLAAVKNIMRRHNGEVILEINEWNGAEFTLKFPILK
jgi:signal transduction histidine kinase